MNIGQIINTILHTFNIQTLKLSFLTNISSGYFISQVPQIISNEIPVSFNGSFLNYIEISNFNELL